MERCQGHSKANFEEVGYFDIFPSSDSTAFNGAWSNYPYYPSGVVTVSGIEQGLFVLKYNDNVTVEGTCRSEALKMFTAINGNTHECYRLANYRVGICNHKNLVDAISVCPVNVQQIHFWFEPSTCTMIFINLTFLPNTFIGLVYWNL